MSVLEDIIFYSTLLTDVDPATRTEAHRILRELGDPALLGIPAALCRLRLPDQDLRQPIIDEVFATLHTIATERVRQLLTFIVYAEEAGDFWAGDVKAAAKNLLDELGDPPPHPEKQPIPTIVTQVFITLVASDDEQERTAAQTILVELGTENLDAFLEAMKHGKSLFYDRDRREQLYLFAHPRPKDLIDTIQMMGTENARAALAWMGDPVRGSWEKQVAGWAKQAALAMTDVKPDAQKSWYTLNSDYDRALGNAESRSCMVCGKRVPRGQGIKDGRAVFCSSACHQKAKNDPTYRM